MYKKFSKVMAMAVLALGLSVTPVISSHAAEIGVGPGYSSEYIKAEEIKGPGSPGRDVLDEIESKKFRVTGYNQSAFKEMTEALDIIYNSQPGSDGYISIYLDKNLCTIEDFSKFMLFEYSLGGQLSNWYFRSHSNNPGQYEIRVNYEANKDVINKHNEAKRLLNEMIGNRPSNLDTVKQIYQEIINNTTYDRSYETYVTSYDVLVNHKSTCHGIASTLNKILEQMDIESYYVVGYTKDGGYHAWNTCIVDGNAYTFDATYALSRRGTNKIWNTFLSDSSMTLGDGRTISGIY